jgi:Glycosyltransferase family 87
MAAEVYEIDRRMTSRQPLPTLARFFTLFGVYVVLALTIILNIISIRPALNHLLDFGSFIAAGQAAVAGENPYSSNSPLIYKVVSQSSHQTLASPNLNPPISVVFFRGIANLEPIKAVSGWRIISTILFMIGIFILGWSYQEFTTPLRIIWAICLAGFWNTVLLGQIYIPVFLLMIGAWIFMEKGQYLLGGIMLGAMIAIKPNFAFWLMLLGLRGYTKAILSATLTTFVFSIIPIFIFGSQIYQQWITTLLNYPSLGLMIAGNTSFQSLTARFGLAPAGTVISLLFIGGSLYFASHHKFSLSKLNILSIVGSLLISPFSWAGYTILALPIFFSTPQWDWRLKLSAALLSFPYILILYFFQKSFFNSVLFGWLYGCGLLLILFGLISDKGVEELNTPTKYQT